MRNANESDVKKAQETGVLEENVMYTTLLGIKLHGKRASLLVEEHMSLEKGQAVAETDVGDLLLVHVSNLRYNKPQSTTPRKPKNRPKKGTKPERKIAIDKGTELKVGDVVEDVDGDRGIVTSVGELCCEVRFAKQKPKLVNWLAYYLLKYLILPYQEPTKQEKVLEEETYACGDWIAFDNCEGKAIIGLLCCTEHNKVMFTAKDTLLGNRWIEPIEVDNSWRITEADLLKILDLDATNIRKVNVEITVKD